MSDLDLSSYARAGNPRPIEGRLAAELLPDLTDRIARQEPNIFRRLWLAAEASAGVMNPVLKTIANECGPGSPQRKGAFALSGLVRGVHADAFRAWLCLGLSEQFSELTEFVDDQAGDRAELLGRLCDPKTMATLAPSNAPPIERRLFESDLGMTIRFLARR